MTRIRLGHLLLACLLLGACARQAVAQSETAPRKRAAVKKLVQVTAMHERAAGLFERMVTRYQAGWPDALIASLKEKGLFKRYTPEQAAKVEQIIRELSDGLFRETKKRVVEQVITAETMEALNAPAFEKHFTADELEGLVVFLQTPTGRKVVDKYHDIMSDAIIAALEARGMFKAEPSLGAGAATEDGVLQELRRGPLVDFEQVFSSAQTSPDKYLTAAELAELIAFLKSPAGTKLSEVSGRLDDEIFAGDLLVYAQRVSELAHEVRAEQMVEFERKARAIFKEEGPRSGGKKRSGN